MTKTVSEVDAGNSDSVLLEVDDEVSSVDIVIVVMMPSGSTVVMTEGEEVVMSVTGYKVSVVGEPSGLTVVMVVAASVSIGKLVVGDSVEVGRTL